MLHNSKCMFQNSNVCGWRYVSQLKLQKRAFLHICTNNPIFVCTTFVCMRAWMRACGASARVCSAFLQRLMIFRISCQSLWLSFCVHQSAKGTSRRPQWIVPMCWCANSTSGRHLCAVFCTVNSLPPWVWHVQACTRSWFLESAVVKAFLHDLQVVDSWMLALAYMWSMIAPKVLSGREFWL